LLVSIVQTHPCPCVSFRLKVGTQTQPSSHLPPNPTAHTGVSLRTEFGITLECLVVHTDDVYRFRNLAVGGWRGVATVDTRDDLLWRLDWLVGWFVPSSVPYACGIRGQSRRCRGCRVPINNKLIALPCLYMMHGRTVDHTYLNNRRQKCPPTFVPPRTELLAFSCQPPG
jgi:hypothetical protein